jgi:hypothetical protein
MIENKAKSESGDSFAKVIRLFKLRLSLQSFTNRLEIFGKNSGMIITLNLKALKAPKAMTYTS